MAPDPICFIYELKPGTGQAYEDGHREVWQEIRDLLTQAGIDDYRIFRRGDLIISIVWCRGDFEEALEFMGAQKVQQDWSALFMPTFDRIADADGRPLYAHEVFRHPQA